MFWNANSTLLASKADVSMNERLFSPASVSVRSVNLQAADGKITYWQIVWLLLWERLAGASNRSCSQPA
jgi:hypothetical protein